ncbi:MAG: hypothetical protein Kow0080_09510 [Candidatus Promineifilaceae bacterium]
MSIVETAKRKASEPETIENRIKAEIEEVVRAYRHSWDIYSELIQNSIDAVNRRFRILNDPDFYLYDKYRSNTAYTLESDPGFRGNIKLKIDLSENTIEVFDNGTGILPDRIEEFLLPKGGDKTLSQEYGFKGYGLTFVAFISQDFHIISHHFASPDKVAHELQLTGLFDWLCDDSGEIEFPNSPIPDANPTRIDLHNWNTVIKVKLANDYSVKFPAVSAAEEALHLVNCGWERTTKESPKGFEYLLRTRTAIGNTRHLFNKAPLVPIDIKLEIIVPDGNETMSFDIPYQYYHPKDHDEISVDAYEFKDYYNKIKRASSSREFRGLYHTITDVQTGARKAIKFDVALAAISSTRLSNIEADLGLDEIESGDVNISYGVHLAIDGMPTGLRIDDWDMKGHYLKRYFVIVDAELDVSNQLDPGRKGISGYYARLISNKVLDLLSTKVEDSDPFSRYAANHLNHGRGREEGGLVPQDFVNKIRQARESETKDENDSSTLLQQLKSVSSLERFPTDEQEVIALFYELVAKGIIKGYRTVYLSSSAPYDAAFDYEIDCNSSNIVPDDTLGLGKVLVSDLKTRGILKYTHRDNYYGRSAAPELCADFKLNLGKFLDELRRPSRTPKDPNLIDLLIFWDTSVPSAIPSTSYTLDEIRDNQRVFHSTTHRLGLIEHHNTDIFCISLKDVLEKIAT